MCVLLVEDEPLIRQILAEELRDAGFKVCELATAEAAAELLATRSRPALLLTDIHTPGRLDGLELGRRVRSFFPDLPVVYMTGRPDIVGSLRNNEVLVRKPFTPPEILHTIRQLLAAQPD